ncbi:hypothetical protein [Thermogemmata fonticola]|uniref:Uncharacterized protein n=1 Tax=Thermogemmata fonticola TaxID=2755323 RepID=A0A7V8VED3_9BACT|nr:hypothetical protein [Thermogemmata fonticola]MBA2226227.1 hypothetical protein [Thermogemmata fonticola]
MTPHCLRTLSLLVLGGSLFRLSPLTGLSQHAFQVPQEGAAERENPAVEEVGSLPAGKLAAPEEKARGGIAAAGPEGTAEKHRGGELQPQLLQNAVGVPVPEEVGRRGEAPGGAGAMRRPHGLLLVSLVAGYAG